MRPIWLALIAACTYSKFQPRTVTAPPDALAKASRVLVEQGYQIATKDDSSGLLVTNWEDSDGNGEHRRFRWTVTITKSFATVKSQCQLKLKDPPPFSHADWEDCSETQPNDRNAKAKVIADAIEH